jgi:hypothetical protein
METQVKALLVARPAAEFNPCSVDSCEERAAVDLGTRPLCPAHFFPACTQELESLSEELKSHPFDEAAVETFKNFIGACSREAQELGKEAELTDGVMKAQCMQFLLRLGQISQRLRRSPRLQTAVPVWLRREDVNRTWEDETWTTTISRHGAGLVCHYPVQTGGTVILCRKSGGMRVRARVVYCEFDSEGRKQIGIEFLDDADIWGLGQNTRRD